MRLKGSFFLAFRSSTYCTYIEAIVESIVLIEMCMHLNSLTSINFVETATVVNELR